MRLTTLRARDPSIIGWKCWNATHNDPENDSHSDDILEDNHLHVYLRIKDGIDDYEDLYQVSDTQITVSKSTEPNQRNTKDETIKKFNFSKIFGPKTKQSEIFDELVKPKLLKFINGHNSTLLTYGVSSSGKTYTIVGTEKEPGVVPRSLQYVFGTLPKLAEVPSFKPTPFGTMISLSPNQVAAERNFKENILNFRWPSDSKNDHINTYRSMQSRLSHLPVAELEENFSHLAVNIWVSFAEIYNEHIYDLLQTGNSKREKLKLGCAHGETYVKNLSLIHVASGLEAYQILQYGLHHLNYAKTNINDHSSRSHSIFTIWLAQAINTEEGEFHLSRFNFCDLAGAERCKKTMNVGERLKESQNINTSLLVLGRCIAAVRKAQISSDHSIIPFRDSKLTQLFQNALAGSEDISMIVNINPCRNLFDETLHVLNFSAIAKDIVVIERPVLQARRSERFSELLNRSADLRYEENYDEKTKIMEECANYLAEFENKIALEEMDQMKDIESMRAHIISGYKKKLEEKNEEMQYYLWTLERKLKEEKIERLQLKKQEMKDLDENLDTSEDSETSGPSSNIETISISSSSEDESSEFEDSVISVSSEDEEAKIENKLEQKEDDIELWKRRVEEQDILIAEHHKTIARLTEELKKFGDLTILQNTLDAQNWKIQELTKRKKEKGKNL